MIVMPTFYGGQHTDTEPMMRAGRALDPARYFIVVPNMFGNGLSSSPSNTPAPFDRAAFPNVTLYDNVVCQHRLVTALGIEQNPVVVGFSMGAQQAFHWGALYSDMVRRLLRCAARRGLLPHNHLFLEGVKAALLADAAFADGWYELHRSRDCGPLVGFTPGWLLSQDFFREGEYRKMGFASVEDTVRFFEGHLPAARCKRSAGDDMELAACRYQREPAT